MEGEAHRILFKAFSSRVPARLMTRPKVTSTRTLAHIISVLFCCCPVQLSLKRFHSSWRARRMVGFPRPAATFGGSLGRRCGVPSEKSVRVFVRNILRNQKGSKSTKITFVLQKQSFHFSLAPIINSVGEATLGNNVAS